MVGEGRENKKDNTNFKSLYLTFIKAKTVHMPDTNITSEKVGKNEINTCEAVTFP